MPRGRVAVRRARHGRVRELRAAAGQPARARVRGAPVAGLPGGRACRAGAARRVGLGVPAEPSAAALRERARPCFLPPCSIRGGRWEDWYCLIRLAAVRQAGPWSSGRAADAADVVQRAGPLCARRWGACGWCGRPSARPATARHASPCGRRSAGRVECRALVSGWVAGMGVSGARFGRLSVRVDERWCCGAGALRPARQHRHPRDRRAPRPQLHPLCAAGRARPRARRAPLSRRLRACAPETRSLYACTPATRSLHACAPETRSLRAHQRRSPPGWRARVSRRAVPQGACAAQPPPHAWSVEAAPRPAVQQSACAAAACERAQGHRRPVHSVRRSDTHPRRAEHGGRRADCGHAAHPVRGHQERGEPRARKPYAALSGSKRCARQTAVPAVPARRLRAGLAGPAGCRPQLAGAVRPAERWLAHRPRGAGCERRADARRGAAAQGNATWVSCYNQYGAAWQGDNLGPAPYDVRITPTNAAALVAPCAPPPAPLRPRAGCCCSVMPPPSVPPTEQVSRPTRSTNLGTGGPARSMRDTCALHAGPGPGRSQALTSPPTTSSGSGDGSDTVMRIVNRKQ